jgi:hypothetical protein
LYGKPPGREEPPSRGAGKRFPIEEPLFDRWLSFDDLEAGLRISGKKSSIHRPEAPDRKGDSDLAASRFPTLKKRTRLATKKVDRSGKRASRNRGAVVG